MRLIFLWTINVFTTDPHTHNIFTNLLALYTEESVLLSSIRILRVILKKKKFKLHFYVFEVELNLEMKNHYARVALSSKDLEGP